MKRATMLAAGLLVLAAAIVHARGDVDTLFVVPPGEMRYVTDPAHAGYETAVVVGDPTKQGVYTVHTKLPPNTTIVPHTHGEKWRVATVLSGTLYYAQGATFDEQKLRALPPGSVIVEPAHVPHFARTKGPVLLHITGEGPGSTSAVK
jgi:quercetin dioxygenase-like cupin family protein